MTDLARAQARILELEAEVDRLRAALAPILRHAAQPDTAPPLRLSVEDCKKIKERING